MNFDVHFYNNSVGKMMKVAFPVLQGSVATYLRCDGKHEKSLLRISC